MKRHREGLFVSGTSAGAAVLSGTMISRGEGDTVRRGGVEMAPGMALWPQSVVDTHFDRSGRIHRLLAAVAQNPSSSASGSISKGASRSSPRASGRDASED